MANPQTTTDTPLSGTSALSIDGLSLSELPNIGKITLRGDASDAAFTDAAKSVLGAALPTAPMTSVEVGQTRIIWKAFDEWLIWTPAGAETKLIADLRKALDGLRKAVVDVSDYYTMIRVDGPLSRELLAKGCPLDLHAEKFALNQATGAGFHQATIFLARTGDDCFDIMIRWSFADYLWNYFVDGAREWGG